MVGEEKTIVDNLFSNTITDIIITFMVASVSMLLFHKILFVLKKISAIVAIVWHQTHLSRGRKEWGWLI